MVVRMVVVVFVAGLVLAAVWPPTNAPMWWRDLTRPARRRLRPRHYRRFR